LAVNESLEDYLPKSRMSQDTLKKSSPAPRSSKEAIEGFYLVASCYDGEKKSAYLKLYDSLTQKILLWFDDSGHKPYCLTDLSIENLKENQSLMSNPGFDHFETTTKYDALRDREVSMTVIVAKDPLSIGGRPSGTIRETVRSWEADIKYVENYIYDKDLKPGLPYNLTHLGLDLVDFDIFDEATANLRGVLAAQSEDHRSLMSEWVTLLECPVPEIKRLAFDIEVCSSVPTRMPDPQAAEDPIICIGAIGSDGRETILLLRRPGVEEGEDEIPKKAKFEFFDREEDLLRATFALLADYPFVITFNGDDFDLRYVWNRAQKLGFTREEIPIEVGRDFATLKSAIHIDLYKFFFNRSVQVYAFGQKYREKTLDAIGSALVGMSKKPIDFHVSQLTY
jgi:DNA polymerase I